MIPDSAPAGLLPGLKIAGKTVSPYFSHLLFTFDAVN
jgi:hypothetical protein